MRTGNCNVRAFAVALSFLTALGSGLSSLPAVAASITYSDPVCSQFYMMPSTNGDVSLRCVQMSCSIAPNGSYIVPIGTPVTLTATCTTPATSFAWTTAARSPQGCPAPTPANAAAMQVQSASAITCWYDVVASDGAGNQGTTRYGIAWTSGSPPSGCSISTQPSPPNLPSSGGNINMTVACTTGGPFTSFTWRKNSANFGNNAATQNDTLPSNTATTPVSYAYDVSVCNGVGCTGVGPVTFQVAGQTVAAGLCGQYTDVLQVDLPTGTPDNVDTSSVGGFMGNGVFVGRFVAGATSLISDGRLSWTEYIDPPTVRTVTVSTQACDFRGFGTTTTDPTGQTAPMAWQYWAQQGQFLYTIAPDVAAGELQLVSGQVYYLNIINKNPYGVGTCQTTTCNMRVQSVQPH